jgi:hypothetical protein
MSERSPRRLERAQRALVDTIHQQIEQDAERTCSGCIAERVLGAVPVRKWDDLLYLVIRDHVQADLDRNDLPDADRDPASEASAEPEVYAAVETLFRHRHTLPNDALRTVQCIYDCCSAARFGERYEAPTDADFYHSHDTVECEAGA